MVVSQEALIRAREVMRERIDIQYCLNAGVCPKCAEDVEVHAAEYKCNKCSFKQNVRG